MRQLILFVLLFAASGCFAQELNIIPQPVSVQTKPGSFTITGKTVLIARDEEERKAAQIFNDYLQEYYGFKLNFAKQEGNNYILITTKRFIKAPEKDAYTLKVNVNGVSIDGDTHAGAFYGVQTLIQLLPVEKNASLVIPAV